MEDSLGNYVMKTTNMRFVGTPSREYLWILARTSKLDEEIKKIS